MSVLPSKRINSPPSPTLLPSSSFSSVKKYNGEVGRFLYKNRLVVKVKDAENNKQYFVKTNDLVKNLIGKECNLSRKSRLLVEKRILEISGVNAKKPLSSEKLKSLFSLYHQGKESKPDNFKTEEGILSEIESLKEQLSDFPKISYSESLSDIASYLKPGDIIFKKIHEDHPNSTCIFQKLFSKRSYYREAYKCSHTMIYLGKIQGKHWIAESTTQETHEPAIRRVQLDDPRLALKSKNQYLIMRPKDKKAAKESARIAMKYVPKLLKEEERTPVKWDDAAAMKYDYLQAISSLWHPKRLDHFGVERLLKHYADCVGGVSFQYLGGRRKFFCSHFTQMMQSLGEMKTNENFQKFIAKHPPPKPAYQHKKGIARTLSRLWYIIKKGVWAKRVTFLYKKELKEMLSIQIDAIGATPQDSINYMMKNTDKFKVVGITSKTT